MAPDCFNGQSVRQQMERVLSSEGFVRNERQSRFLRFLIERHLEGRDSEIKESLIGVEVFGRRPDYDPKLDAIVRTEAVRLRARLTKYYAGEGREDSLVIELPKGGYVPAFRQVSPAVQKAQPRSKRLWRALALVGLVVPGPPLAAEGTPGRGRKRFLAAAVLVLVVVSVGILIASHQRTLIVASEPNPSRDRALSSRAVPLTAFHGLEKDPALSPDGKHVAFAWNGENQDNFDIYVVEIASGTRRRITTDPAEDMSPAWSPDGHSIAFLRRLQDDRAALLVVPSVGGPEHPFGETRNDALGRTGLPSVGWSMDGRWVASSHRDEQEPHEGIYLFSLTGEKRRLTTSPQDSHGDHMAAFSPDGRKLAFCRLLGYGTSEIYVVSLDNNQQPSGEELRLTSHKGWSVNPAWASDGSKVLYVLGPGPDRKRQVRIVNADADAASGRALTIDDELWQMSIGRHLVYTKRRGDSNIWRARISAPGGQPVVPELFNSSTAGEFGARYSPDGRRISFVSFRSGSGELWISNADGSETVRMTSFNGLVVGPAAWSPDGQWLVFHAQPEGQADLFVMPAAGGTPRRLAYHPSDDNQPTYSRDGQWVYFNSTRTGRLQIFRMPSGGGDAIQITRGGGKRPVESPDGKTVFYLSESGDAIRQVPITGGIEAEIVNSVCLESGFALTTEGLVYPARTSGTLGNSCEFRLLTLAGGQSRLLARTSARPLDRIVSVSPDGKYFLFGQSEKPGMDLMLIENFLLR